MGVLLEADATELFGCDLLDIPMIQLMHGKPLGGGEDGAGLIVGEQVAYHLGTLGHEESLTASELLLLQLTDKFDLIFTDHKPRITQITLILSAKILNNS